MRNAVLMAAFLAVFTAVPALAEPAAGDAATAETPPNPNQIVCHAMAPVVGSRLGARRQCATQREWDQRRADSQKALTDSQTHTFTGGEGH